MDWWSYSIRGVLGLAYAPAKDMDGWTISDLLQSYKLVCHECSPTLPNALPHGWPNLTVSTVLENDAQGARQYQ